MNNKITSVPTNVITGFLGVGKTSAIKQLIAQKPKHERWAILVNEFGEIGVDGQLFSQDKNNNENIFIKEVTGGCMCCASTLHMQVALNQLLKEARPNRLLIEPTGLGHPKEVLELLQNEHYNEVLSLGNTLTLVDPRHILISKYTDHPIFNQQLEVADVVIGNKIDLGNDEANMALINYLENTVESSLDTDQQKTRTVYFTSHGKIPMSWLEANNKVEAGTHGCCHGQSSHNHSHKHDHEHHHHDNDNQTPLIDVQIPDCGYISATNHSDGFESIGWRFSAEKVFDYKKLTDLLSQLDFVRIKGVCITTKGAISFNHSRDSLEEQATHIPAESRLEIIHQTQADNWHAQLLACLVD